MAYFKILAFQNPQFKILADFKILAFHNSQFKILADFKILAFHNPEFKILADFKMLAAFKIIAFKDPEFKILAEWWTMIILVLECKGLIRVRGRGFSRGVLPSLQSKLCSIALG